MVRPDYDLTITKTTTQPSYEIETGTIWSSSAIIRRSEWLLVAVSGLSFCQYFADLNDCFR